ncbi:Mitochondrial transcription termination factor family protein [Raphanus sativus]|uniref:Transcription termination factor MTERF2, chloroplastic-like n=1 Tax=Raphanus sativus TaxID=3726 RepID=A0A9W3C1B4_RAPSA|nr:transcription termination factor MTERF2, chloroplastic-like [Raphanus sativus]XP_056845285.1 transcription termination factor MTERF2, chloroplastic-like [Raphanus sativus]KAJ4887278.1 Mitochondrial transcription termination factor family protein [Raphanus sativus]
MYSLILHGRSLIQFPKRRSFSVPVTLFQNASTPFSTSSSSVADVSPRDSRKGKKNFTVSYLVGSLGLSTKLAESISRRVSFDDKTNPDSVLSLFRSHGFTDSQISTIITDNPRLLLLDAEKSLAPKLNSLQSRGRGADELTEIVSKVPRILDKREGRSINLYYDVVKEIIVEADKIPKESCSSSSRRGNKMRNVLVLRDLGMPQKLFLPLLITLAEPICGKERFEVSLKKVIDMGFDPTTSKFVTALRMLYQMSDKTVEEKVNLYKTLGFAVGDVWEMFKKYPFSLAYSEKKITRTFETFLGLGVTREEFAGMIMSSPQCIGFSAEALRRKTEFLVEKMNWPLKALVSRPQVYNYSMEKMIVPRSNVIGALMSRGLLRDGVSEQPPPLPSVFACTEQAFLNRYVLKVDDEELVAELMAIFNADSGS